MYCFVIPPFGAANVWLTKVATMRFGAPRTGSFKYAASRKEPY